MDRAAAPGDGGIIPAYAGSTSLSSVDAAVAADHPRIRGEHVKLPPIHLRSGGSSPHTRGARDNPEQT